MVFVNNNVHTYENLYVRNLKIRNIPDLRYMNVTVAMCVLHNLTTCRPIPIGLAMVFTLTVCVCV